MDSLTLPSIPISSNFQFEIRDENGNVKQSGEFHNLITRNGARRFATLADNFPASNWTPFLIMGNGTTPPHLDDEIVNPSNPNVGTGTNPPATHNQPIMGTRINSMSAPSVQGSFKIDPVTHRMCYRYTYRFETLANTILNQPQHPIISPHPDSSDDIRQLAILISNMGTVARARVKDHNGDPSSFTFDRRDTVIIWWSFFTWVDLLASEINEVININTHLGQPPVAYNYRWVPPLFRPLQKGIVLDPTRATNDWLLNTEPNTLTTSPFVINPQLHTGLVPTNEADWSITNFNNNLLQELNSFRETTIDDSVDNIIKVQVKRRFPRQYYKSMEDMSTLKYWFNSRVAWYSFNGYVPGGAQAAGGCLYGTWILSKVSNPNEGLTWDRLCDLTLTFEYTIKYNSKPT